MIYRDIRNATTIPFYQTMKKQLPRVYRAWNNHLHLTIRLHWLPNKRFLTQMKTKRFNRKRWLMLPHQLLPKTRLLSTAFHRPMKKHHKINVTQPQVPLLMATRQHLPMRWHILHRIDHKIKHKLYQFTYSMDSTWIFTLSVNYVSIFFFFDIVFAWDNKKKK